MIRTLSATVLAALALSAVPAFAQDDATLDAVGVVVAGLADGATIGVEGNNLVVTRTAPGAFSAAPEGGEALVTFAVAESEECVFDIAFSMQGAPGGTLRFNPGVVDDITFTPNGEPAAVSNYTIELVTESDEGMQMVNGAEAVSAGKSSPMTTSLTLDELNAAADALQETCPGPA